MKQRWIRGAIASAGLALAVAGPAPAAEGDLAARLARALAVPALRGARVAALVVDAEDGRVLFARAPGRALAPASNQKLLTAAAALATFGPTHRFVTRVLADREPDAHGRVGTLYLLGGGDPALTSEQCWRLALDLRRRGLRAVEGDLVVDDRAFDRERWHPAWGPVSPRAYDAPVGALSVNYGAFALELRAGAAAGEGVRVSVDPPVPYLRIVNRLETVSPRARSRIEVERTVEAGGERFVLRGRLAAGTPSRVLYRSVARPEFYAGALLAWQLGLLGIPVGGRVRSGPVPNEGVRELLAFEGFPLGEVVRRMLKFSSNPIAESLWKAVGAEALGPPGTWEKGRLAVEAALRRLGIPLAGARLVDGSGLARTNRISPRTLVATLRLARSSFAFGPELLAALPIAAADGTLAERAGEAAGRIRAKTGHLDGVSALSGLAWSEDGRERVFSLLVNGARASDEEVMRAVDRFASELVKGGGKGDGER